MKTEYVVAIVTIVAIVFALALWIPNDSSEGVPTSYYSTNIMSVGSQTSFGTLFTPSNTTDCCFHFYFDVGISYNSSWNLVYWVEGSTQNYTLGKLSGSGNFETQITFYAGYGEETLCASGTKLDNSQNNLTLTIFDNSNNATASHPMVQVCGAMAP